MTATKPRVDFLFGLAYHPDVRVKRASQALAAAGYQVRILAWDRTGKLPAHEWDGPVEVRRVQVRSHSGRGIAQLAFLARAVAGFVPHLRQDRPDVLHVVDLPMLAAGLCLRPFIGKRPKVVYDAFEIYLLMVGHWLPGALRGPLALVERYLPRAADLVITVGEARRRYFADRGIDSVVVGNWIDPPATRRDRAAARAELGIEQDRLCIAYTGGLLRARDLDMLVQHAERHPEDVVLVAGRGELEQKMREHGERLQNFRYLGWMKDPSGVYAATDLLYYSLRPDHPYAVQAAPNNLYEAIAHAIPIVYRRQGELAVVGDENDIGEPFEDAASFDAAVDKLRDPERRARIGARLRALQERYSWRAARRTLLDAYRDVLAAGTRVASPRSRGANGGGQPLESKGTPA
jgi:glycosyltransferase involved in cell wall biosynthesis